MRTVAAGRIRSILTSLASLVMLAITVAACSGGSLSGMFSGSGSGISNKLPPVSFANVIGPPGTMQSTVTQQLVTAAQQKNIPVITERGRPANYTVQGYLSQSNERRAEKFTYIMDVSDQSGKRVHRIIGEDSVPAKAGAKPWSSFNQAVIQKIATKTATDLATWLPSQSGARVASASPATAPRSSTPPPAASPASTPPQRPPPRSTSLGGRDSAPPPAAAPARTASRSTASSGGVAVRIPPVSGAPGDGRSSLASALGQGLAARGVQVARTGGNNVYTINGKVSMGPAPGGQQSVRIVWSLIGPKGEDHGSVTQNATVAKGSLDKRWGKTAQDAGNAAAAEMMKLIRKI